MEKNPYKILEDRMYAMHRKYHKHLSAEEARSLAYREVVQIGILALTTDKPLSLILEEINKALDERVAEEEAKLRMETKPVPTEPVTPEQ